MSEKVLVAVKAPEVKNENSVIPVHKGDFNQLISSPVERIHFLQRTIGNHGVRRLMKQVMRVPEQRVTNPASDDPLTAPLTDREWGMLNRWLSRGEVGIDQLTEDENHNADLVASAIFCHRMIFVPGFERGEDPLLCVEQEVTQADPRVRILRQHVISRGPIIHWAAVPAGNRMLYVMELLVNTYQFPVNAAAGIVGNLHAESGVLPGRIEGSDIATPMRAANVAGTVTDFSPEEVMNRGGTTGPRRPGIGIAQWTTQSRRAGLFARTSRGRQLGSSILFNMDAQVEYLVSEIRANASLNASLTSPGVTLNSASDNVVYQFEIPGSILDGSGQRLPRTDPAVQSVFNTRRANSQQALQTYQAAQHP